MSAPAEGRVSSLGAAQTIGRGVQAVPALRRGFGLTLALAAVGAAGRLVVPVIIQQVIDRGIRDGAVEVGTVTRLAVIGALGVIVATAAQRLAVIRLGVRSEEALYDLRVDLFDHIHRLSLADHNEERRGALVARVTSDVETLAQFFAWGGLAWLLNGTLMILVAGAMLAYNWLLALVAFAVAAPLFWVLRVVQRRLVAAYDLVRSRNADLLDSVSELVTGAETLRAYSAGSARRQATRATVKRRADSQIRAGIIGAFLFPSGELFSVFAVASVVTIGVALGPASGLTAGALVGFIFLTYRFLEPIAEFTEVLDQTQTAVAGLRRVLGVLEIPIGPPEPTHPVPLPPGPLALDVEQVSFAYPSRSSTPEPPVLVDVNVSIPPGQQVALVGSTGSGKTTLGRLVARLADPTEGVLRLGGVPLTKVANADLRSRLVVVPQEPFLFDDTIAANLAFARPGITVLELQRAVADLDLADWLSGLPDGLATPVGQRGAQLSAGERQLVALVRASLVAPDVLVLDEATSAVDAVTEVRLARALERLARGCTTIAIAHRLSTAMRADRVLVLEHGRLVEDGHHHELITQGGTYADLYRAWVAATVSGA